MQKNSVTADYHANHKEVLATTIPYSSGWHLKGTTAKLPRVNEAFIGIPVKSGHNHLQLVYQTPLLKISFIVSIICLIILVALALFELIPFAKIKIRKNSR